LSRNTDRILAQRRQIERRHVEEQRKDTTLRVIAVIPVRGRMHDEAAYALRELAGRPLIDYTLDAVGSFGAFQDVLVVSEDDAVLRHAATFPGVLPVKRPAELARPNTPIVPTVRFALEHMNAGGTGSDAFMLLYVNTPLRTGAHIRNAVDNMLIFEADSVISVYEDLATHYQHVGTGLRPLIARQMLRLEREALWVENGAIYLARVRNLEGPHYLGDRIAHTVMAKHESLQIDSEEEFLLVEQMLKHRQPASTASARLEPAEPRSAGVVAHDA
jgi:N-acylneuraminate cytidylyltransferase